MESFHCITTNMMMTLCWWKSPQICWCGRNQSLIDYTDKIYLDFGATKELEGITHPGKISNIRKSAESCKDIKSSNTNLALLVSLNLKNVDNPMEYSRKIAKT